MPILYAIVGGGLTTAGTGLRIMGRQDVMDLISANSPYEKDRSMLEDFRKRMTESMNEVNQSLTGLRIQVAALTQHPP